jgi:anti-anti-sigma regulatory factor
MAMQASRTVALPEVLDLDSLDGIRDVLTDALEVGPVTVSASRVERVATNGLFMLMSAAETARQNNFDFAIEAPSSALTAAIDRLGLAARFEGMTRG